MRPSIHRANPRGIGRGASRSFRLATLPVILMGTLAAGCAPSLPATQTSIDALMPVDLAPGERLNIAASTGIVGDIVRRVGGEAIDLMTIVQAGKDPHDFEPTPREIQSLSAVDAVFLSGLGLETTLERALGDGGASAPRISLSEGLADTGDPHVWLDPRNVLVWIDNVARSLSALDPAHAGEYAARAEAYRAEVEALDQRLADRIAEIPEADRKIVSDHDMLGHLAGRYGLQVVGSLIPAASSAAEPSARDLARLHSAMDAEDVRVIVVASSSSTGLAEAIAEDRGARLVRLFVETLSDPGGPAETYLELMEYNLAAIVEALKP